LSKFLIYTDGGCKGNRRYAGCTGGFGYLILDENKKVLSEGGGKLEDVTNNIMELYAVIKGVEALIDYVGNNDIEDVKCIIKTDSRYIVDNYYDYVPLWKRNGWRKATGSAVLNKELWMRIVELSRELGYLKFVWVKAHASDLFNKRADELATEHMNRI